MRSITLHWHRPRADIPAVCAKASRAAAEYQRYRWAIPRFTVALCTKTPPTWKNYCVKKKGFGFLREVFFDNQHFFYKGEGRVKKMREHLGIRFALFTIQEGLDNTQDCLLRFTGSGPKHFYFASMLIRSWLLRNLIVNRNKRRWEIWGSCLWIEIPWSLDFLFLYDVEIFVGDHTASFLVSARLFPIIFCEVIAFVAINSC